MTQTYRDQIRKHLSLLLGTTSILATLLTISSAKSAQAFSCGPYTATYVVRALDQRAGQGIRCVKFSPDPQGSLGQSFPVFVWYGEGRWGNVAYRHLGAAFLSNDKAGNPRIRATAGDMYGNGEGPSGFFQATLLIPASDFASSRIRVTGAWNEEWIRVKATNYTPLPSPRSCGGNFAEYRVSDLAGRRNGSGIRCVLGFRGQGSSFIGWYGTGTWGNGIYTHIGTPFTSAQGGITSVSDLCDPSFGTICNDFSNNSLVFNKVQPRGWNVTGSWSEKWR